MSRDLANTLQFVLLGISSAALWHVLTAETNRGLALTVQAASMGLAVLVYRTSRRCGQ